MTCDETNNLFRQNRYSISIDHHIISFPNALLKVSWQDLYNIHIHRDNILRWANQHKICSDIPSPLRFLPRQKAKISADTTCTKNRWTTIYSHTLPYCRKCTQRNGGRTLILRIFRLRIYCGRCSYDVWPPFSTRSHRMYLLLMITPESIDSLIVDAINAELPWLLNEVKSRTPEDTTRLLGEHEIVKAKKVWWSIVWEVKNDKTPYGVYVEYWVWRPFNYHKPKGTVFRRWVGARMFTLAFDENQEQITKNITKSITEWISRLTK